MHLNVSRHGPYVIVDIKANAFVHHMVRNIVGSLMEIGCGNQPESWMAELLAAKDRTLAAATAKAEGLYLGGGGLSRALCFTSAADGAVVPRGLINLS